MRLKRDAFCPVFKDDLVVNPLSSYQYNLFINMKMKILDSNNLWNYSSNHDENSFFKSQCISRRRFYAYFRFCKIINNRDISSSNPEYVDNCLYIVLHDCLHKFYFSLYSSYQQVHTNYYSYIFYYVFFAFYLKVSSHENVFLTHSTSNVTSKWDSIERQERVEGGGKEIIGV